MKRWFRVDDALYISQPYSPGFASERMATKEGWLTFFVRTANRISPVSHQLRSGGARHIGSRPPLEQCVAPKKPNKEC